MIGQSQTLSSSEIIFITLFSAGAHRYCAFYQPWQNCAMMLSQNKFSSTKRSMFWLFFIQFSSPESHILSTAGDALSQQPNHHVFHTCALNTPYKVCSSQWGALCGTLMALPQAEALFTLVLLQKIIFTLLVLETKNNPTCSPEMNKWPGPRT